MPLSGEYVPSTIPLVREQVDAYERSGGTEGTTVHGMPMVIITTRGAKSGKIRKIPVMRVEDSGLYAVVASKEGNANNPQWYHNIVADPHVELQDGTTKLDMRARLAEGDERARWWERALAVYAEYADYEKRTTRRIPVFVLEPL
jgi:deazaflavin-dependent oxidoreductase (nitroreductase family)